jgi:hypothetical protein
MRSKARRLTGVGSLIFSKLAAPIVIVLRVSVARWSSGPRKLCRICPSGLAWTAALAGRVRGAPGGRDDEHADQHVAAAPVVEPVADRAHVQAADHANGFGVRSGVGGVAWEDPDPDRAAVGVGEQPVLDLGLADHSGQNPDQSGPGRVR